MNQHDLRKIVIEKLRSHTEYNTSGVQIKTSDGLVELSGPVDGEDAKASIEGITRSIEGVTDVINYLKISKGSFSGVQGIHIE